MSSSRGYGKYRDYDSTTTSSSGHNFYGEHRGGARGGFGGRGYRGGYRSRGRGGRGFGSPDEGSGGSGPTGGRHMYKKSHSEEAKEQVDQIYNKKFKFQDDFEQWKLPDHSNFFSHQETPDQLGVLLQLKDQLNKTKAKLDSKDMSYWRRHTNFTNRAAIVTPMLRRDYQPEMCTQAWSKLQEILWTFKVVPETTIKFNSVHLCEAPGAFVASLNHFLKTHRTDCEWTWKAMTLNPYYEGNNLVALIDQDKFMSETTAHWFMGVDNTGDITNWDNMSAFVEEVKKEMDDVQLVTADGSINCFNNPGEQESLVASLLFCETVGAIKLLRKDGCFILKTFTTMEHHTVCLMYLLNCCFSEVHVFKPATSKAGNSEQYVVCLGYKGHSLLSRRHMERLKTAFGPTAALETTFFPLSSIPKSFLEQLVNCVTKFAKYQMDMIEENVRLYDCMKSSEKHFILEVKELTCDTFKTRFKMKSLPREKTIVQHIYLNGTHLHLVPPEQGNLSREWLLKRSSESFISRLSQRRRTNSSAAELEVESEEPAAKRAKISLDEGAVEYLLKEIGYEGGRGVGQERSGDQIVVAMEMTPEEVQWLKSPRGKNNDICSDLKSLDGKKCVKLLSRKYAAYKHTPTKDNIIRLRPNSDTAHPQSVNSIAILPVSQYSSESTLVTLRV